MAHRLNNRDLDAEVKAAKSCEDDERSTRSHSPDSKPYKEYRDRRRSRSRSPHRRRRSQSRERRRSRSRDRDRRRHTDGSKYSSRRHSPDRPVKDEDRSRHKQSHYRRHRSRSSSTERHEKDRERSKLEMRQMMAKNYEEQLERLKNNQYGPPPQINRFPNQVHVEPSKLVEQIEKRKFLFKKDKPAEAATSNSTVWKNTAFTDDSDGKMSAKFKRLMGMKEGEAGASSSTDDTAKKQSEYFANLEKQYEVARATTHTQRGLGLGFSSGRIFPVHPKP